MLFRFKKQSKATSAVRKVGELLKHAHPALIDALTADISILDALIDSEIEQKYQSDEYRKESLAHVLLAAANYHLKLKLGKAHVAPKDLPLVRYLNPADPSERSFASTCKRIYKELESCDTIMARVHWAELRNIYVYLLSRIA